VTAARFLALECMDWCAQMQNLLKADHPGCARFRMAHFVNEGKGGGSNVQYVAILAEYIDGGDLYDFLTKRLEAKRPLSETERKMYFKQLVVTVAALHERRIVHRDLKLDNILVTSQADPAHGCHLMKICDFGMSKGEGDSMCRSYVGTYSYRPPEIFAGRGTGEYSGEKADVWSLGVVLYLMRYYRWPFGGADPQTLKRIIHRQFESETPADDGGCGSLLLMMLSKNPGERPTCQEVLSHPWLQGVKAPFEVEDKIESVSVQTEDELNEFSKRICALAESIEKQQDSVDLPSFEGNIETGMDDMDYEN